MVSLDQNTAYAWVLTEDTQTLCRRLWREITSSVLFGDVMVQNGIFWTIGEQSYIVYYRIISYLNIKVYRVETMDMGRSHCNNGVIGTFIVSISTTLLIVRDKIPW